MKLVVAFLALAVLSGCGSGADVADSTPRYDVTVIYWPQGPDRESLEATLQCFPHGGTHPDPDGACAALAENEDALEPVPGNVACTDIYGGNQVATITGDGLQASFSRQNGCQIARWEALKPVLELEAH